MPRIHPFVGLRPVSGFESKISAKSTDYATPEMMVEAMKSNPYTYLRLTKTNLLSDAPLESLMQMASGYIEDLKKQNLLLRDSTPCLYLYKQTILENGHSFLCLMAACEINDYDNDVIKKHENTQVVREKQMAHLFESTGVLGEGVLLSHNHHDDLKSLYKQVMEADAASDFVSLDNKKHQIWVINDAQLIQAITKQFEKDEAFYIADGHHRSATVSRLNQQYKNGKFSKFLVCLIDETQLEILPFYRWLSHVHIKGIDEVLEKIGNNYKCFPSQTSYFHPENKGEFGMYFNGEWYKLIPKHERHFTEVLNQLDVSLLERFILKPLFGIEDSKTDHRLNYKSADRNLSEFCSKIDDGTYNIGFTLHAPEIGEIKEVSNLHQTMPPKSTYIQPKLRAGMVIMEF